MTNLINILKNIGLSDKAARVYLAALELGEATILGLANKSGVKRTSIYYTILELVELGALTKTKRNKKVYYLPDEPKNLIKRSREKVWEAEELVEELEKVKHSVFKKPRVYFLYGPSGFKKVWDMVFEASKEYRIMTEAVQFIDFVKEKYILDEIIASKKKLGISSKQIIVDSPGARKIVAKDARENRESRLLPSSCKLPFTEIIAGDLTAFISPRFDNTIFIIENENFAKTRKNGFDLLWSKLEKPSPSLDL